MCQRAAHLRRRHRRSLVVWQLPFDARNNRPILSRRELPAHRHSLAQTSSRAGVMDVKSCLDGLRCGALTLRRSRRNIAFFCLHDATAVNKQFTSLTVSLPCSVLAFPKLWTCCVRHGKLSRARRQNLSCCRLFALRSYRCTHVRSVKSACAARMLIAALPLYEISRPLSGWILHSDEHAHRALSKFFAREPPCRR